MADATLSAIILKVRRLTHSQSPQQISDDDIKEYVNTFILYDIPPQLRLFTLRKTLTFYTQPNIDTYESNSIVGDPLEDFKDKYNGVYDPVYVAGYRVALSQSEREFYDLYPFTNTITTESTGDGITTTVIGTLGTVPVLRNHVVFNSKDASGNGMEVHDDGLGAFDGDGVGTIDYVTGDVTITWTNPPGAGEDINSIVRPYTANRPNALLYFNNKMILRPVPDQVYPIQIEVDARPTELILTSDIPDLEQWWQYIAYGAAKKVFEDRSNHEGVAGLMPEFQRQEDAILYRTLAIMAKERTATIYSQGYKGGYRYRNGAW